LQTLAKVEFLLHFIVERVESLLVDVGTSCPTILCFSNLCSLS